ncbi:MAG: nitroreductase family protein [Burkholderiaceae bacterium]|nr:nitroreductase family protein [Burkholderiaceae bacterium]
MNPTTAALRSALAERFGEAFAVPEDLPGQDELLRIATHTTHRAWAERPIAPEVLTLLGACALSAPSKSYLLQADIVHVQDPARREAVQALVPSMPWMAGAPALLVFCGNGRRFRRIFSRRGQPFTNEHLDGFFNPAVDASLVMMNFIRAAAAAGLVCCPISVLRDQAQRLAEILEMPDHVFPVSGLCVGYPVQSRAINPRLSMAATWHTDRFDAAPADEQIDEFDRRFVAAKEKVAPANATKPAATWSDEKAKQYANAQRADWGRFVRARKFDLS